MILHFLLAGVFALFAYFQLNDPDPAVWVTVYSLISISFIISILVKSHKIINLFYKSFFVSLVAWMFFFIPDIITWGKAGFPAITGVMNYQDTYIELMREFFGLGLCLLALAYLIKMDQKHAI